MSKKVFMTPVWWMLVLGIIATAFSFYLIYFFSFLAGWSYMTGPSRIVSFFFMPMIMFVEATMYWTIRKRIHERRDAWKHMIIFACAYFLTVGAKGALLSYITSGSFHMSAFLHVVNDVHIYLFWGLVIAAHVFFARVIIKAFAGPPVVEGADSGNLLDDVLD